MDKIILKGMEFWGKHGVLESEHLDKQPFIVSLELSADLEKASITDNLEDTINYSMVYEVTKRCVEDQSYHLLEALAVDTVNSIFSAFEAIEHISIQLEKPKAPIDGKFDSVGVILSRDRE